MRTLGVILAVVGVLVIGGYWAYYFFRGIFAFAAMPLLLKIAFPAAAVGILLLLASVGWERYKASKKEEFKEKF